MTDQTTIYVLLAIIILIAIASYLQNKKIKHQRSILIREWNLLTSTLGTIIEGKPAGFLKGAPAGPIDVTTLVGAKELAKVMVVLSQEAVNKAGLCK